jgi:hypothetical protein
MYAKSSFIAGLKDKGKVHPGTGHEGHGGSRGITLGGLQGWSGRV